MNKKIILTIIIILLIAISYKKFHLNPQQKISIIVSGILQGNLSLDFDFNGSKGIVSGGALYLGSFGKKLRDECISKGRTTIWVDNGDNISGTPDAYYTHGEAIVSSFSKIPFDSVMLGNREFDFGKSVLFNLISQYDFYSSSNIIMEDKDAKYPFKKIIKVPLKNNKYALILAVTPPNTPLLTVKRNVEGLKFLSLKKTLELYKKEIDDSAFTIIISQYTMKDIDSRTKIFKEYATDFFVAINVYDINVLKPFRISDNVVLLPHYGQSKGAVIEKMDFTLDNKQINDIRLKRYEIKKRKVKPDNKIANIVDNYRRRVDHIISEVIGESSMDFKIDNFNEMALGDLVADWLRDSSNADICMINSNSMRVGINSGKVTREDLYRAFPFDNYWVLLSMSGKQILETMRSCYSSLRPIFQISGATIVIDREAADPIVSFKIHGKKVDPNKKYKVVTNSFLAQGGDGYAEFYKAHTLKEGKDIRRLVEENIKKYSPLKAKTNNRIIIMKKGEEKK